MTKLIVIFLFLIIFFGANAQCWKMIAPGGNHTLAIKNDGTLWATGFNISGQLGDNSKDDESSFIQIGHDADWVSVTATVNRSYAIKSNGTLWAWGFNFSTRLGLNTQDGAVIIPTKVGTDENWLSLSLGHSTNTYSLTYVIKTDNTLWQLIDMPYQLSSASNWKAVSVGGDHTLSIKTDGTLWGWGFNDYGQLGNGSNINVTDPEQIGNSANWKVVSAGANHSLAIKTDGTLWATGGNNFGQLGDGTQTDKNIFTQIGTNTNWKTITAGDYHSFATRSDGTLWVWGVNNAGELGIGSGVGGSFQSENVPTQIDNATNWASVFTNINTTFALKTDGSLWGWGYNSFGQLGDGSNNNKIVPVNINCNSSLPIILSSFIVQNSNNTALLTWKTAMEINSKEYQLERSSEGIAFKSIAAIISKNSLAGSSYTYTDSFPLSGYNYYRIRSVDKDGKFSYSNIQAVNFSININQVSLYPNPAKNTLSITDNFKKDKLSITITDLTGRKLMQQSISNNLPGKISIVQLKAGIYIVNVSDGINSDNIKIIKE